MKRSVALATVLALVAVCGACSKQSSPEAGTPPTEQPSPSTQAARKEPQAAVPEKQRRPPRASLPIGKDQEAISGVPFAPAPPWRTEWCVSHAMSWSEKLEKDHVPKGAKWTLASGNDDGPYCHWGYGDDDLTVGVKAGASVFAERDGFTRADNGWTKSGGVTHGFSVRTLDDESSFEAYAWSRDPPVRILAYSGTEPLRERKRRVRALIRDMTAHLTAERLSHPMAQIAIVNRDKTGERARALLKEWPYLKAAFDHVAPLAPGYPRMAKGSEFRGDPGKIPEPDDQFLLLAVCHAPGGESFQDALLGLVPPEAWYEGMREEDWSPTGEYFIVDGKGLTVECPRSIESDDEVGSGSFVTLQGGRTLSYAYVQSEPNDPIALRGAVILRDKQQLVLDVQLFTIDRPQALNGVKGRYGQQADRRIVGDCRAGFSYSDGADQWVSYGCKVEWSDFMCKGQKESFGERISFDVTDDDRINLRRSEFRGAGTGCWSPE